ncbi:MAG TPA: hypothetical protein VMW17_10405 [Candidatus Binatia bacterium]|nr:hypothetical protein [Candidatus Binatia bacterium]
MAQIDLVMAAGGPPAGALRLAEAREPHEWPWSDRAPGMPFIGFVFATLAALGLWSALGCGIWALWWR